MKKRIFLLLLTFPLSITLSGCAHLTVLPIARDIANVQLMRTMALDEGEDGKIKVTVSGDVRPGGDGGGNQPPVILKEESETVFGAVLHIQTYGDGYVSFGHISQCILSGAAAQSERGAVELLDFLQRDFETRMTTDLYLTEEKAAADILTETASETESATERLESLRRDFGLESQGWRVTAGDFLQDMAENGCGLVPILKLEKAEDGTTIVSESMGWFRNEKFRGKLTAEQSRGAAILEEKLESGGVELTMSDGTLLGLRLTGARCRWRPIWEGDRLTGIEVKVSMTADLAEAQGQVDLFRPEVMKEAERRLSGIITGELREVLSLSQGEKTDFLHLKRKIAGKSPSKYRILDTNWERWFPDVPIRIETDCDIRRSYDVTNPIHPKGARTG